MLYRIVDTVENSVVMDVDYDIPLDGYQSPEHAIADYNRTYSVPFAEMQRCHGYAVQPYEPEPAE